MKIQYMGVIFIVIMLPIILVLNVYMGAQMDSLSKHVQYDTKLFEATLDGIQAFELNTVNNRFSQIADSLKRDVDAGINTFISSLAYSMGYGGIENTYLLPYLPAVLFTLYDGYYIYTPTYAQTLEPVTTTVKKAYDSTEETEITVYQNSSEPAKRVNLLKPYIYYTMRYIDGTTDFIANYTLDNYLIIYGYINGEYYTKSGFLSVPENITVVPDVELLGAIFAKKFLDPVLSPNEFSNLKDKPVAGILNDFKVTYRDRVDELIDEHNEKYATSRLKLQNELGKTIYDRMTSPDRDLSYFKATGKTNELLEALFDANIDETFEVDRQEVLKAMAKQMLIDGVTLKDEAKNNLKFSTYGNVSNAVDAATFQQLSLALRNANLEWFNNNSIDLSNLKGLFGEKLVSTMIKEKGIHNIKDGDLFKLVNGNPNLEQAINKIGNMTQTIDAFKVEYTVDGNKIIIDEPDAKKYYVKSLRFTNWVNKNLKDIEACDAVDAKGAPVSELDSYKQLVSIFDGNHSKVFYTSTAAGNDNNPEVETSAFAQHRRRCIQHSIQTNLNNAISQYNQDYFIQKAERSLKMPQLAATEWQEITSNISMVTFFQGMNVGDKIYNDYVVVTSNKNKETINIKDIFYINTVDTTLTEFKYKDNSGNDVTENKYITYCHRIGCPKLKSDSGTIIGLKNIDFDIYKDKDSDKNTINSFGDDIKEICTKYGIDGGVYACYDCIVNRTNYTTNMNSNKLKAQYEAIAKEKNNLYKVNSYYNTDILTEFQAPASALQSRLADKNVGEYVNYQATTGGNINWKILSKDASGNVYIISEQDVDQIKLVNKMYANADNVRSEMQNAIQASINQYTNTAYFAELGATRLPNASDIPNINAAGTLQPETLSNNVGYWLSDVIRDGSVYRISYIPDDDSMTFNVGDTIPTDWVSNSRATSTIGVRLIVKISASVGGEDVWVNGGDGSKDNPYQMTLHTEP